MADDPGLCTTCGRQRWSDDRFCAACGAEFADISGAGVIDVDGLSAASGVSGPARSNWRDSLKGLGALGAVLALLVGGLYLASGDENDDVAEEVAGETVDRESVENEAEPTTEPTTEPTAEPDEEDSDEENPEGEDPDTKPSPTPRPTPIPAAAPVGEALAGLDVGARWLLAMNVRSEIIAHDLVSGELHILAPAKGSSRERVLLSDGAIEFKFSDEGSTAVFETWSAAGEWLEPGEEVDLGSGLVGTFTDSDVGRVLLSFTEDSGELSALAVATGETRILPIHSSLLNGSYGFSRFFGRTQEGQAFVVGVRDEAWGWTWADGWVQLSAHEPQFLGRDFVVGRACSGPTSCRFALFDYEGTEFAASIPWEQTSLSSLSPDGRTIVSLVPGSSVAANLPRNPGRLTFVDVESGSTSSVEVGVDTYGRGLKWSPNSRYLLAETYNKGSVVDVSEGTVVGTYTVPSSIGPFASSVFVDEVVVPTDG